jgi:hypothetical protein
MRTLARALLLFALAGSIATGAASRVPSPESVFGFAPGADYKLATYDQSVDYLKKVADASKFVRIVEAGPTSQGRTMYFALVSSPDNLAKIDRYREIARRLAHPQGLSEADARRLAREGKAFVHIDGGLHSTEVAGGQHVPLLLYNLLTRAEEPEVKPVLDNVVLMLWPTINPDGQQMVAEWYMQNVGTPYELAGLPRLYQDYVGHDNNRDAYMLNMIESRTVEHTWRQWEPQIIYVHHQSGPFPTRIWLPPFSEPVGIDAPYLMSREVNMIVMGIAFIAPIDDAVMDYSFDFTDGNRRVAAIIDKVLRGANPGEIPLELPERPNFMLNRRIARELGMEIPNDVLLRVTDLVD